MNNKSLIKKSRQIKINRQGIGFDKVYKVLILWDSAQSKSDIDEIKTFGHELRKSGKDITFLAFHMLKKFPADMRPNEIYRLCCKGDFNIFAGPKSKNLKDLLNIPYDLLINGCLSRSEYLTTISVFSKARFRIGPFFENEDTNFYELLVKPNGANPCENYLIEIGRYLRKII